MIGAALPASLGEVLLLGAHADDIEIGCGATVRRLAATFPDATFRWVVLSATPERAREAEASAEWFLQEAGKAEVRVEGFREGYFPWVGDALKDWFEQLKHEVQPDLVLTHTTSDRHQDHRVVAELTWNTFRDHLVYEYGIPKYDGADHQPNTFVPIERHELDEKVDALTRFFPSQRHRSWFRPETFVGTCALRGVEGASPTGFAEAFHVRKHRLDLLPPGAGARPEEVPHASAGHR